MTDLPITQTHHCTCAEGETNTPELDASAIPHAIRHAAILGALQGLGHNESMILVAPHNPLPLLDQIDSMWPDVFSLEYVQEGPDAWKIRFTRVAA
ncbi:DUF2249 domain-containing protein [Propionibacterium freudenreichii]|uniref:DUF2249 domain-containing protein n=1 Tax=Propionibacterium freudenreichii TaxID=1744 RepID=UPI0005443D8D|nr:DUF2249 domain-containing protein [Propionibacterium freudenreichii]AJQ90085.1 Hemerythrin HHE cation binding region [Propionibacterium freudenreichii subsp. freudenreichii]MDK9341469.1 DUF2249 domain-containing protein [Propionibacterium freudenreichii]WBF60110.1 DUF2249 domain-containing protein [Propionibacterium freudenreichii]WBF63419.1 DUF2249 domain-containing protein [Propionibacterium freudenreichii]CEG92128.1 Hemerythrin HHE cation binding region [Propionibacterium freudenreichii]